MLVDRCQCRMVDVARLYSGRSGACVGAPEAVIRLSGSVGS